MCDLYGELLKPLMGTARNISMVASWAEALVLTRGQQAAEGHPTLGHGLHDEAFGKLRDR